MDKFYTNSQPADNFYSVDNYTILQALIGHATCRVSWKTDISNSLTNGIIHVLQVSASVIHKSSLLYIVICSISHLIRYMMGLINTSTTINLSKRTTSPAVNHVLNVLNSSDRAFLSLLLRERIHKLLL